MEDEPWSEEEFSAEEEFSEAELEISRLEEV